MLSLRIFLSLASASALAMLVAAGCGNSGGTGGTGGSGGTSSSASSTGGHAGAGGGVPCGDETCTAGRVCVVQVDTVIKRFCADDHCAPEPLSCDCASPFSSDYGCGLDYYCVSATNGQISCMPSPDGGS